jgi:two-component system sensor histidine kinase YesM
VLFVDRIRELIHQEYDTRLEAKNAQINALQAQINPHFLYNTLQLMGSVAYSRGVHEVNRIAEALSDLMRYSMNYDGEFVTLDEELRHLNNYFFIQKQRFYDKFAVELAIDEQAGSCRIPKLLIQPIVENCFSHGFESSTRPWRLSVMAFLNDDDKIHIIVRDNGVGMSQEHLAELRNRLATVQATCFSGSEHIGLLNVHARIRLYFSGNDGLQIDSTPETGTKVTLIFDAHRRSA